MLQETDRRYEPADILVYLFGKGLVCKEKSLLAYEKESGKILAFGTEAEHIAEGWQGNAAVCSPLRQGVVADHEAAVKLFTLLLRKALGRKPLRKPAVAICVPKGISKVERRALEDMIYRAGARKIILSDIPLEQFVRDFPEKLPKLYREFKVVIGITKDEPEDYIKEQLADTRLYAAQAGISKERVAELLSIVEPPRFTCPSEQTVL